MLRHPELGVEEKGRKALKKALEAAKGAAYNFAYAPSAVLNKAADAKFNKGQPEGVLVLDKNFVFKRDAGFADKLEALTGETVKVTPSLLLCGKLRYVKGRFVAEVDTAQSKGVFDKDKAQIQLRKLGAIPDFALLKTAVVSDGPLADADVSEPQPGEGEEDGAPTLDQEKYNTVLATVDRLLAAFDTPLSDQAKKITERAAEGKSLAENAKWQEATAILEEVQGLAASALRAQKEAKEAGGRPGVVAFTKSRLIWGEARKKASSEVKTLQKAILTDPDTQRLPNFDKVMENVKKLGTLVDDYAALENALDTYQAARGEKEQAASYAESKRLLKEYKDRIDQSELMKKIDDNPYVPVKVFETLNKSLDAIGTLLKA
jgi:hypothetical protein